MSYNTTVTGQLGLEPSVPFKVIRNSPFYRQGTGFPAKDPAVAFHVDSWEEDTDRGVLTVRVADAIWPAWNEPMRAYSIMENLIELLAELPAGTRISGYLSGRGEADTDLWRIYVVDGKPVKVQAAINWPLAAAGIGPDEWQEGRE